MYDQQPQRGAFEADHKSQTSNTTNATTNNTMIHFFQFFISPPCARASSRDFVESFFPRVFFLTSAVELLSFIFFLTPFFYPSGQGRVRIPAVVDGVAALRRGV